MRLRPWPARRRCRYRTGALQPRPAAPADPNPEAATPGALARAPPRCASVRALRLRGIGLPRTRRPVPCIARQQSKTSAKARVPSATRLYSMSVEDAMLSASPRRPQPFELATVADRRRVETSTARVLRELEQHVARIASDHDLEPRHHLHRRAARRHDRHAGGFELRRQRGDVANVSAVAPWCPDPAFGRSASCARCSCIR